MSKMVDFIHFVVSHLVNAPEQIEVKEIEGDTTTIVEISVAKDDAGHVIGKKGNLINALREVVCATTKPGAKKIKIEVV